MEKKLRSVCKKHSLRTISVMLMTEARAPHLTVYAHWGEPGAGKCASGSGGTFDEALAVALDDMARAQITAAAA